MSDPEDKIDKHRDAALNGLVSTIEATGGLVYEHVDGIGDVLVPKGDTEREWSDLAEAYLEACKALDIVPLIDGKRKPKILGATVTVARAVGDYIGDEQNENEVVFINNMFTDLPEDVEVKVYDRDGVYLYSAHKEV